MSSPSSDQHHAAARAEGEVPVAIVTVSDSRTPGSDVNAQWLRERIDAGGHRVAAYRLVRDEPAQIQAALDELLQIDEVRVIVFNGGTGISRRDTTYDVIARNLEKEIPGFGELFRMLSWQQVGAAAMLSRATAGTCRGRVVLSVPGSPAAVRLAWDTLIAPELQHLAWEVGR
jgi:molybdopterin adenylyltransferase